MRYDVKLMKTILSLNISQYSEFTKFLFDVEEIFLNNLKDFNKIMNQFSDGKRSFLNRNYNSFINKYRTLLNVFSNKESLNELINCLSNINSYKEFLKLINYINSNVTYRLQMLECVKTIEKLHIKQFILTEDLSFPILCSETNDGNYHSMTGLFTDGNTSVDLTQMNGYTKSYTMNVIDANYIIFYTKDNIDGVKNVDLYIRNLQFDPYTLPDYVKLNGKNSWQNFNADKTKKKVLI